MSPTRLKLVKRLAVFCIAAVALVMAGAALLRKDPLSAQVDGLFAPGKPLPPKPEELWKLGPQVIPLLARKAQQRDTPITKGYKFLWTKAPAPIRARLPIPLDSAKLRAAAMQSIAELGPLAAYGAAAAVIGGLSDPHSEVQFHAGRAIEWLVPESAEAMVAYTRHLADTNNHLPILFSLTMGEYIWPRTPQLLPLLTNWLRHPQHAYNAAIALRFMNSNAVSAIPPLIETLNQGVAGSFSDNEALRWYASSSRGTPVRIRVDDKALNHNRAMAAAALGAIGLVTPQVTAALTRGWRDSNAWVRAHAAEAIGKLRMTNTLPELITALSDQDNRALAAKLQAIGNIGKSAREALAILHELTAERLRGFLDEPDCGIVGMSVQDIALAAKIAICRIDPERSRVLLPDLTSRVGVWWEPVECLRDLRVLSQDVIRNVELLLESPESLRQSLAAYIILSHDLNHIKAREVLERKKQPGEINQRLIAAQWLFETIGSTNDMCLLIEEGFRAQQSHVGQSAAHVANKLGAAALPLVPALKQALWHKDKFVREKAGMLLRKLAPEELAWDPTRTR